MKDEPKYLMYPSINPEKEPRDTFEAELNKLITMVDKYVYARTAWEDGAGFTNEDIKELYNYKNHILAQIFPTYTLDRMLLWQIPFSYAIYLVSGANMAALDMPVEGTLQELKDSIKNLDRIIDAGYYDDDDGNELMKHIRKYLQSKIKEVV